MYKGTTKIQKGFTFIDLMTSLSVIFILLGIAVPTFATIRDTISLQDQTQQIISALRTAQSNSIMSLHNVAHGVAFSSSEYAQYEDLGSVGDEQALLNGLTITSGAPQDVLFERLTGRTIAQEIVITTSRGSSKTIFISDTGTISIE